MLAPLGYLDATTYTETLNQTKKDIRIEDGYYNFSMQYL
jgi:hypothetical protein